MDLPHPAFARRTLGVATQHGKEQAISEGMRAALGLVEVVAVPVDTDRFGTFSGERPRTLTPEKAALAKAHAGAEASGFDLVIASEGSFGPHPHAPMVACDEEVLVLFDRRSGRSFIHRHLSLDTVLGEERCTTLDQVFAVAERFRFPTHGLVVKGMERPGPGDRVEKGVQDTILLERAARECLDRLGEVWVSTDQRAMMNPTRMAVIRTASEEFARELNRACSSCGAPHFRVVRAVDGLPCAWCGTPTARVRAYERACADCGHGLVEPRPDAPPAADPGGMPQLQSLTA